MRTVSAFLSVMLLAFAAHAERPPAPPFPKPPLKHQADSQEAVAKWQTKFDKKKKQRLQKIQQLTFDRRPSTILKAWAEPPAKKDEDETDNSKKPAASAPSAPANLPPGVRVVGGSPSANSSSTSSSASSTSSKDPFDARLKELQRNVTLGRWGRVRRFFSRLHPELGKAAYDKLVQSMMQAPTGFPAGLAHMPGLNDQQQQQIQNLLNQRSRSHPERNAISFDDFMAIAGACPYEFEDETIQSLSRVVLIAMQNGHVIEKLVALLEEDTARPAVERVFTRRQAAQLLFAARQPLRAAAFLPSFEKARDEKDLEALNLLSQVYLAQHAEERKSELLEKAWDVTQVVLEGEPEESEERQAALKRSVELAPKLREEHGEEWLNESFTKSPLRGMEIIATIGADSATSMRRHSSDPDARLRSLKLQTTAVEALLDASPQRAEEWKSSLSLLAMNWLREGLLSYRLDESTSYGPQLRRDMYGNYFYYSSSMGEMYSPYSSSRRGRAIKTGDVLDIRPSDRWLAAIDEGLKPKFDKLFAQLFLKVQEDDRAFPYIEKLAQSHPEQAEELVDEFLQVWTKNHNPNAQRSRTSSYMFMYGFDRRAEGIPLTRSKQERNLEELSELVRRLNALPIGDVDQQLLAKAFTTCHSTAEVYRLEAIEKVFGPIENLKPVTLAELAQQMRSNLAGIWRQPAEQEKKKTNRKKKDIQAEVFRGYQVARTVVTDALAKHPDSWQLMLARAAVDHDENNYRQDLANDSGFTSRRKEALAKFAKAAELYAKEVSDLHADEQTTKVYDLWYYASLGAVDLGGVNEERIAAVKEPAKIREAIMSLPGDHAQHHLDMFANNLFTRMSSAKPAVKFRYLKAGFEIVGDNKRAHEARKVYDYYNDLVNEIKLETIVDGNDVVGHEKPFGVFVNLRHTREIERESGGFGRYLQNQNNAYYSYNYGRPTENYRDKFEEIVRQAFEEHFEVFSVTFQSEDVNSRALDEYGWRYTPYAYILVKARGPKVDKIPPVRLDLDFLDTSGYVVLPIESPPLPIDASRESSEPRPYQDLRITQTLDERQADEGKLILEVKATAQGLVPDLDQMLDLSPKGFKITNTEDDGNSVSRFDPESPENVVVAERIWMITLEAADGLEKLPETFDFGTEKVEVAEMLYQRYDDADLASVEPTVTLGETYGEVDRTGTWVTLGAAGLGLIVLVVAFLLFRKRGTGETHETRFAVPEQITPFTVIGLLKDIRSNNGLSPDGLSELESSMSRIERYYFDRSEGEPPDLERIALEWSGRARNGLTS